MAASITQLVNDHRPALDPYIALYKHFHAHPELSLNESATAAKIISELQRINPALEITPSVGGHGVTAVLHNGGGGGGDPTLLLRADTDALPVRELTNLPYASTHTMRDASLAPDHPDADKRKPVMHACGHDMHVTSLLAAAELLSACAPHWRGTVVFLFQPAEEKGSGARAMLGDGLFTTTTSTTTTTTNERIGGGGIIPVPDVVLGGHVMPQPAGYVGSCRGLAASSADSVDVTVHGRGGHASQPQRLVDPVVLASAIVLRLQTLVSRECDPADHAVCTVASLQAGDAENVVADRALLRVDLRAMRRAVREQLVTGVERIVRAECVASGCAEEPEFRVTRTFPLLWNDDGVTERIEGAFTEHFGEVQGWKGYDKAADRLGGSEDFGELATAVKKPSCFWVYGGTPPEMWKAAEKAGRIKEDIPINHSAKFAPAIMPTLQIAIDCYAVASLIWLRKP